MSLYIWCMWQWIHLQARCRLWVLRNGRETSSNQGQTVLSLSPPFQLQSLRTHFLSETFMEFRQWGGMPVLHKKKKKSLIKSNKISTCLWSDLCSVDFQASLNVSSSVNLFCQDLASVWHAKMMLLDSQDLFIFALWAAAPKQHLHTHIKKTYPHGLFHVFFKKKQQQKNSFITLNHGGWNLDFLTMIHRKIQLSQKTHTRV